MRLKNRRLANKLRRKSIRQRNRISKLEKENFLLKGTIFAQDERERQAGEQCHEVFKIW